MNNPNSTDHAMPNTDADHRPTPAFGLIAKGMHWGFVLLFIYGVIRQVDNVDQLADAVRLKFEIIFAIVFLLLLGIRYLYMRLTQSTALPPDTHPLQKTAAKIVHYAMYLSLAAIAVSGLLIGGVFSLGLRDGFLMSIALGFHEFSVSASYALIALHIAAAVYHRFRRDGVWDAMVPFWKERG